MTKPTSETPAAYDKLGTGYNTTRRADLRIVDRIIELLDIPLGSRILDVGAGTGSYSHALAERGYEMTALEPSAVMREQGRQEKSISWVAGSAESLPFADGSFDGAILILCIHHFSDLTSAFSEIRRVVATGSIVIFTYDPAEVYSPWLFEYFPVFREQIQKSFPSIDRIREGLHREGSFSEESFPLPHDLVDGFAGAAWRFPERYLDQAFRDGTSAFRQLDASLCEAGLSALANDLKSGSWDETHGDIRSLEQYDHGYKFIVAKGKPEA